MGKASLGRFFLFFLTEPGNKGGTRSTAQQCRPGSVPAAPKSGSLSGPIITSSEAESLSNSALTSHPASVMTLESDAQGLKGH